LFIYSFLVSQDYEKLKEHNEILFGSIKEMKNLVGAKDHEIDKLEDEKLVLIEELSKQYHF
jgi:hypothetical protein